MSPQRPARFLPHPVHFLRVLLHPAAQPLVAAVLRAVLSPPQRPLAAALRIAFLPRRAAVTPPLTPQGYLPRPYPARLSPLAVFPASELPPQRFPAACFLPVRCPVAFLLFSIVR